MSHSTPETYLVWSILSCLLGIFLVYHLWSFDRFRCLRWSESQGAFKRIMTYTYILGVPLTIAYSVGFCVIKYQEGYTHIPGIGRFPKPYELWSKPHQNAVLPLYLCISIAWALEMVTHLESLCFWLFLVNAGSAPTEWFKSPQFKTWALGSIVAVLYLPSVTLITKSDPLQCEAYTFLAGSAGSLLLTICFMLVLPRFRTFLKALREEGVDMSVVVRITKFQEFNTIYAVCRMVSAIPLIILAADGLTPHHHINDDMFATEFLAMISGFGITLSAAIALPIFFPRSIEGEIAMRDARRLGRSGSPTLPPSYVREMYADDLESQQTATKLSSYSASAYGAGTPLPEKSAELQRPPPASFSRLEPNRRTDRGIAEARLSSASGTALLTADNLAQLDHLRGERRSRLMQSFRSPFDAN